MCKYFSTALSKNKATPCRSICVWLFEPLRRWYCFYIVYIYLNIHVSPFVCFPDFNRSSRMKVRLNQTMWTQGSEGENDFPAVTTPPTWWLTRAYFVCGVLCVFRGLYWSTMQPGLWIDSWLSKRALPMVSTSYWSHRAWEPIVTCWRTGPLMWVNLYKLDRIRSSGVLLYDFCAMEQIYYCVYSLSLLHQCVIVILKWFCPLLMMSQGRCGRCHRLSSCPFKHIDTVLPGLVPEI